MSSNVNVHLYIASFSSYGDFWSKKGTLIKLQETSVKCWPSFGRGPLQSTLMISALFCSVNPRGVIIIAALPAHS